MTLHGVLVVDDQGETFLADIDARNYYQGIPLAQLVTVPVEDGSGR